MKSRTNKFLRRLCAAFLAAVMLFSSGCSSSSDDELSDTSGDISSENVITEESSSSSSDSGKEEVVYVSLNSSGTVENISVVNIWGSGDVTDYGDYTSVKMLTSTADITQNEDTITFSTDEDRVYYQGVMDPDTPLPWNVSVKYYIDGTEYDPKNLAGTEGALTIDIDITENTECDKEFYNNFALQVTILLDTEKASNITAEGSTMADSGSDKQISYIALPGSGLSAQITADVTDFEMEAISINGIRMSLDIDIEDDELEEKIDEIMDAVEQLKDGSEELDEGAGELLSGSSELVSGTDTLNTGMSELNDGISSLSSGMDTLLDGLDTLNDNSSTLTKGSKKILKALNTISKSLSDVSASTESLTQLSEAAGQIQTGIQELYDGTVSLQTSLGFAQYKTLMAAYGLDIDSLTAGNTEAAETIEELIPLLDTLSTLLSDETIAYYVSAMGIDIDVEQLETLANTLVTLLNGNNAAISGMESYLNSVSDGAGELVSGAKTLNESYQSFYSAINTMTKSLDTMITSLSTLKSGIETLLTSYSELDEGIEDYTDGVAAVIAGYEQLIDGTASLASGGKNLTEGTEELAEGTAELYEGIEELDDGTGELLDGTSEFYDELEDAREDILDELIDMLSSLTGEGECESFVSEKNTEVDTVQFVYTTSVIEVEETEEIEDIEEENNSFIDKFIDLFR